MTDHPDISKLWQYDESSPTGLVKNERSNGSKFNNGHDKWYWRVMHKFEGGTKIQPLAHRVVWIIHNGPIAEGMTVDHIDNDGLNNLISNLRLATKREQAGNRKRFCISVTGFKGVKKKPSESKFSAQIRADGKSIHLGMFDTAEEAHKAYCDASKRIFGLFHNPG